MIRQRAIRVGDKQERHYAILDAAERLFAGAPGGIANMAEVASQAGLAKGTVYLYFPSKEALLLALHERNIGSFFQALIELFEGLGPIGIGDVFALIRTHVVEPPLSLPLASRCLGVMDRQMPADVSHAFKMRMADRFERAGAGLEKHFPVLHAGDGVALLRHSYALALGLWQMAGATVAVADTGAHSASPVFAWGGADELERAIFALWQGTLARAAGSTLGV